MGMLNRKSGLAIGALLLASCARNDMETAADAQLEPGAQAQDAAAESDGSIVVTGSVAITGAGPERPMKATPWHHRRPRCR